MGFDIVDRRISYMKESLYAQYLFTTIASAAQKATTMNTTDRKRKKRPESNFHGNILWNSFSA